MSADETRYRFLPSVRRGLRPKPAFAEGGDLTDAGLVDLRLDVQGRLPDGPSDETTAETSVQLYGPGDVIGLDTRQVVRTVPARDATDVEPNYFPHVEFDRPDLPWLFSPERADDDRGRARPWLALVVVEKRDGVSVATNTAGPLPVLTIGGEVNPRKELPPSDETWAWAHAQVVGDDARVDREGVEHALESRSNRTISRLIAPRKLRTNRRYLACVVPTFEAGRRAGLGADPTEPPESLFDIAWAPGGTVPDSGPVRLPVYYHWEFATGPRGDFEALVRALEPRELGDDVGSRPVDLSDPGVDDLAATELADGELRLGGALRSVTFDPMDPEFPGTAPERYRDELRGVVDLPDTLAAADGQPVVGPPTYGQWHADVERLSEAPGRLVDAWLDQLNLDPRNRVTASFGTSVIQANQEALMAAAWDQFGDLNWANRLVRATQLARAVGEVSRTALADVSRSELLSFTGPMHSLIRRRGADDVTVYGELERSQIPRSVVRPAFRRLLRPTGPLARRLDGGLELAPILAGFDAGGRFTGPRMRLPESTISSTDRLVEAGVTEYLGEYGGLFDRAAEGSLDIGGLEPDGGTPSDPGKRLVIEALGRLDGVEGHCETARRRLIDLEVALWGIEPVDEPGWAAETVERFVFESPTVADRCAAIAGSTFRPLSRTLARLLATAPEVVPGLPEAEKDELLNRLGELHVDLMAAVDGLHQPVRDEDQKTAATETERAIDLIDAMLGVTAELRAALLAGRTKTLAYTREPAPEDERTLLSLEADLPIGDFLDVESPLVELVADRIEVDVAWLDGRDDPLDEIMAAPEIERPMYEPLRDLSASYLCPGVGNIPSDTVAVLETSPPFVEAYMAGLSHEMARELLWRRYPTDRRGTYFRRFWDYGATPTPAGGSPSVDIEPIHRWLAGDLGEHSPGSDGDESKVVLIIRGKLLERYPNTRIYAVKAIREERNGPGDDVDRVPLFDSYLADIRNGDVPTPDGYRDGYFDDPAVEPMEPIFRGTLAEDVTFFGFDLVAEEALGADDDDEGWFFVLEEPPGEPRFGLDVASEGDAGTVPYGISFGDRGADGDRELNTMCDAELEAGTEAGWNALSWGHLVGTEDDLESKHHVRVMEDRPAGVESGDPWAVEARTWTDDSVAGADERSWTELDTSTWGWNSAHMARITWQLPVRVAIHADDMLPRTTLRGRFGGGST